jgi:hypothetical protein
MMSETLAALRPSLAKVREKNFLRVLTEAD